MNEYGIVNARIVNDRAKTKRARKREGQQRFNDLTGFSSLSPFFGYHVFTNGDRVIQYLIGLGQLKFLLTLHGYKVPNTFFAGVSRI